MKIGPEVRQRRHTQYFTGTIRAFSPVFLDTDVDMGRVLRHRAAHPGYSVVSYVAEATGHALAAHPEANAALRGRLWPRLARYDGVHAKITLDKTLDGHRVVLATVVPDVDTAGLPAIQERISHFRDGDPQTMPEFGAVRVLHKLPRFVGLPLFRLTTRSLRRRPQTLGTVAITSLGHRPVNGFHSVGGTTVTLGVGQIADRPVVRDGALAVAPVMRLSLAFDHRVIDGAEAADLLTAIKDGLEGYPPDDDRQVAPAADVLADIPSGSTRTN
ncbi:2-oxo acid dehydrogenase subunit E2 [Actinacidiphila paucisporea]|uniref:2-oxoacid dehydrogenases acyltransferase (Catalytic domain) n=1 Tax=Actinacidiphila paucisporea TaxID=310782 RepID=A0A1M7FNE1_9ACTN|nr:2-oxo acid dehydrogenase subunit E2 [Actinacidiphila paucisporea]SHM05516.1 2-oxoacid dehydrogenases acyltransferase (catalytic domain) [Actinacidiphila paucisporea]